MNRIDAAFAALLMSLPAGSAAAQALDTRVFTLYRSSIIPDARIHVGTFDAGEKAYGGTEADYNRDNCQIAASLFREQPGVKVLYWCEPGRAPNALELH